MKSDVYGKILVVPPLLVTYIPILVFLMMKVFYRRRFDQISLRIRRRLVVLEKRGGCLKTLI